MADISIPPPDTAGYWHFTYLTTDPETGEWYGGKRSTKKHPLSDPYKGSGNWIKQHPARERLRREIVAFYATPAEVFAAEATLVTWNHVFDDPLCMNECGGGYGMTTEQSLRIHAGPKWLEAVTAGNRRKAADPQWLEANATRLRRMHADPNWRENTAAANRRKADDPNWQAANLAGNRRKKADPEWQKSHAEFLRRLSADPNWRAGILERWADPEFRAKMAAANRRSYENPERKEKLAATMRRLGTDPEFRARMKAMARRRWDTERAAKAADQGQRQLPFSDPI